MKKAGQSRPVLIAGPTAGGKSAVALALAKRLGGVVVNADSMQVYRDLRVLTARPGAKEETQVPHALYGFVPAVEAYSTGRWLADAEKAIAAARASGLTPIITGGTGLYFKALTEGLSPVPDIPETVRQFWRGEAAARGAADLHALLKERDEEMARRLEPTDSQRVVRALEVLEATGRSLAEWQKEAGTPPIAPEEAVKLFVAPERDVLHARIDARFDRMMREGALDEVAALAARNLDSGLPVMRALGVKPLMRHLAGDLGRKDAVTQAKTETRRYAKRQLTWARSNMITWKWFNAKDSESLIDQIFAFVDV